MNLRSVGIGLAQRLYRVAHRAGLFDSVAGDALFSQAYLAYKRYVEDRLSSLLLAMPEIARGGHIFDDGWILDTI